MTALGRTGRPGSGLISPDNDDPTAEAAFRFLDAAQVDRGRAAFWNVIPWWNGTIRVTGTEHRAGLAALGRLLDHFADLRVAVLVGNRAGAAETRLRARDVRTVRSAHPSPQVRAANRALWDAIPAAWAEAARIAGAVR